jgi:penicillin-binding protein-related factor A (putative recombinase)
MYDLRRSMKPTEKQIQDSILQWLNASGIFHYRQNTGAFSKEYTRKRDGRLTRSYVKFGTPGSTDIVVVFHGMYIGIEVKDDDGEMSEDQENFMYALNKSGGVYLLVRSLDEVINYFNHLKKSFKH